MNYQNYKIEIASQLIKMRLIQLLINEKYKKKEFKIPIHLALGHESIALATAENLKKNDKLILSHRNIHYNIALGASLKKLVNEYLLNEDGLASGKQGSMNLTNKKKGILYTSSILGNNLGVGAGVALGQKYKNKQNLTCIVTGDGAIEEGSFYETMLILSSLKLPSIIIVENNGWSLGSTIKERRTEINMKFLSKSFGGEYFRFNGNDIFHYLEKMKEIREIALKKSSIVLVEVILDTLGDWKLITEEFPKGKYINYHAGPAPKVNFKDWPIIKQNKKDPLHVLKKYLSEDKLKEISLHVKNQLV